MEDNRLQAGKGMSFRNLINAFFMSKLLKLDKLRINVNNEQLHSDGSREEDLIDSKSPKELGKNSWLHSADDFGKMEKGRVL